MQIEKARPTKTTTITAPAARASRFHRWAIRATPKKRRHRPA